MYRWFGSLAAAVLAVFLIVFSKGISLADGKGIFSDKNCGGCHQASGRATVKTLEDNLKQQGPELWYSGNKFKKAWLVEWLEAPVPLRPMKFNSVTEKNTDKHPALSKAEAKEVADYLMTLKAKEVKAGIVEEKATAQGKIMFVKKYGCVGCHVLPDKAGARKFGGLSGPDLSQAGKRLKGDWVYAYLKYPAAFQPIRRMPIFAGIIPEDEMKVIAGFITGEKR